MRDMEEMTVDISGALNLPLLALSLIYRSEIQIHEEAWQHLMAWATKSLLQKITLYY